MTPCRPCISLTSFLLVVIKPREREFYLLGPEHHGHHALGLRGLGALVDQDGAELHLGQTRISGADAGAADDVGILDPEEEFTRVKTGERGRRNEKVRPRAQDASDGTVSGDQGKSTFTVTHWSTCILMRSSGQQLHNCYEHTRLHMSVGH